MSRLCKEPQYRILRGDGVIFACNHCEFKVKVVEIRKKGQAAIQRTLAAKAINKHIEQSHPPKYLYFD